MAHFSGSNSFSQRRQRSSHPVTGSAFFGQSFPPNAFALTPPYPTERMNPQYYPSDTNSGFAYPRSYLPQEQTQHVFNAYPIAHPVTHPIAHPVTHPIAHPIAHPVNQSVTRFGTRSAPVFTTSVRPSHSQASHAQASHVQESRQSDRTIRPFVEACRMCYDLLVSEFQTATHHMTSGQKQVRLNPSLNFQFHSARGDQQWQLHTLLYGKKKKGEGSFYKRDPTHNEYGILNPFVAVQFQLYQAGLYLTNISDPDKSFSTVFKISRTPPTSSAGSSRNQWHGQHRLMFDPDSDSDFLRKYIEKIYLNDAFSVADFLNTMYTQTLQSENIVQTIRRTLCPDVVASVSIVVPNLTPVHVSVENGVDGVDGVDEPDIGYDDEDDTVGGLGRPE